MKKIFAFAIAASAVLGMQAQDAKTLFDQAKKLDDQFNKAKPTAAAPNKQVTPDDAKALLEAMAIYSQVEKAEAGEAKPKFSKKVQDSMKKHAQAKDFYNAAIVLYNANMHYPEAYEAFLMSGDMTKAFQTDVDTIYALDYFNAGNLAYGKDFAAAAKAYEAARAANVNNVQAYIYDIGSRQQLMQQNPDYAPQAKEEIYQIAQEGIKRFGTSEDFLLNNYLQHNIDQEKYDEALAMLAELEAQNPGNANIYRLRGIISNANNKYADAIPAFTKMAELTDNYNYLSKAADDLNRIGKMAMGRLDAAGIAADQKAEILNIFNSALAIAQKAKAVASGNDAANADDLIEQIEYSIGNANKL